MMPKPCVLWDTTSVYFITSQTPTTPRSECLAPSVCPYQSVWPAHQSLELPSPCSNKIQPSEKSLSSHRSEKETGERTEIVFSRNKIKSHFLWPWHLTLTSEHKQCVNDSLSNQGPLKFYTCSQTCWPLALLRRQVSLFFIFDGKVTYIKQSPVFRSYFILSLTGCLSQGLTVEYIGTPYFNWLPALTSKCNLDLG